MTFIYPDDLLRLDMLLSEKFSLYCGQLVTVCGEGVNVLFADDTVRFVRPEDSGPPDKISNPYIEEDTDIYADTGDPYKHAWIRWAREHEEE